MSWAHLYPEANMIGDRDPKELLWRASWHLLEHMSVVRQLLWFYNDNACHVGKAVNEANESLAAAHGKIHECIRTIIRGEE